MKNIISLGLLAFGLFGITAAQSQIFLEDGLGTNYRAVFTNDIFNTEVIINARTMARCVSAQSHVSTVENLTLVQACHKV